ncbi:isocitrate lyase/PEP mutase family protein [Actinomycetospora cinnamomea]|uniref:2-methylisocitrate lyase-like PEP mutase family enzyme n=1 Tax=Actinomycetospora cinnamomea TaxID=663609 RepID=A0A2U1FI49_9PSEU|nr:isocitrate lyase/phosphoenolpyruvate mutase family protein [Actinomycetospora cinnamomea]PVZ11831.1 2-methylisocitrate lyase-like PEP mutase family enzyme [Actinomycetospora cinnamomea]
MSTADSVIDKARELQRLHSDPELLVVVNVWDAITATTVANTPGTRALATASHGIAASRGYPDGEVIPRDEMIAEVGLIARQTELPVTADLEAGYGDPGGTIARAIDVGVVGANLEDQLRPLSESVKAVEAAVAAAESAGVPFALNARTDAWLRGGGRDPLEILDDAITRGRAYLEAGATSFFCPGRLDEDTIRALVDALGERKVNVIGVPGMPGTRRLGELGVARVSFGPWSQNVALTALAQLAEDAYAGGGLPEGTRKLN